MKEKNFSILRRIAILIFVLITVMCTLFMVITYFATIHFYEASTQLLNKDVAGHIAKFSSPFEADGINKTKADSVFQNAMVISPSDEVYFLDTSGKVIAFHANASPVKEWNISLDNVKQYIADNGAKYIKGPDPRDPLHPKIFSASEVNYNDTKLGYIYVILGSNQYRSVSEMLFSSHVSNLAVEAFCVVLLLSVIISLIYLTRIQSSFKRLSIVLKKFEEGDYNARFTVKGHHELAPVTNAFNKMADQLVYNISRLTDIENVRKDFIAHTSHDLRTPLSIARGYTETLIIKRKAGNITEEEWDAYLKMILNKILQVEHMVSRLFELSKIESAAFNLNKEPFVLSEIAQETINNFQLKAKEKNVSLKCTQCQYHVWVNADVNMMERVIQNLAENAVKNAPETTSIQAGLIVSNNELTFQIANDGPLLSDEMLQWINAATEKDGGSYVTRPAKSGLGLIIVKRILYLHNTSLKAFILNNQNVFTFSLPIINPSSTMNT